ncbi:uncharacterized protein LOC111639555 [Centruroides sculpturatus]|uniref:uncharacterized protein LOC111639555 n=1 Tax=Centruroides sculpturatus TaxID=218467 RepID=UPI000C6DCC90|nr:uncharacterized protein LOC111639555 [Centruroides sculpturatus]
MFFLLFVLKTAIFFTDVTGKECVTPEEYRNNSCEAYCTEGQPLFCNSVSIDSDCYCGNGTVRDNTTHECISPEECTKKICGPDQQFVFFGFNVSVCTSKGYIVSILILPYLFCSCENSLLDECALTGKCLTEEQCDKRQSNPMNCSLDADFHR